MATCWCPDSDGVNVETAPAYNRKVIRKMTAIPAKGTPPRPGTFRLFRPPYEIVIPLRIIFEVVLESLYIVFSLPNYLLHHSDLV